MRASSSTSGYIKISKGGVAGGAEHHLAWWLILTAGTVLLVLFNTWSSLAAYIYSSNTQSSLLPRLVRLPSSTPEVTANPTAPVTSLDANNTSGPPYRFPKLIHQTVKHKRRISCEEQRVIQSWKELNPGYTHRLWDDNDIRQFMLEHHPEMVPVPFDELMNDAERADIWRVLVLHKYGGVYADIDVMCLRPIDTWNAKHGHDAALLLGLEDYKPERQPHSLHVNNWAFASMPGHPLLGRFPGVVSRHIQRQFFEVVRAGKLVTSYEHGILERTGPDALTTAMYDYFEDIGVDMSNVTERDLGGKQGFIAGGVRIASVDTLSSGWQVAAARQGGRGYNCSNIAVDHPEALVCHMFWGTWRSVWHFKQQKTYGDC